MRIRSDEERSVGAAAVSRPRVRRRIRGLLVVVTLRMHTEEICFDRTAACRGGY